MDTSRSNAAPGGHTVAAIRRGCALGLLGGALIGAPGSEAILRGTSAGALAELIAGGIFGPPMRTIVRG